ncbi:MAG: hypothetical protein AB7S36_12805 [Planctomycetota bacterium]
MTRKLAPVPSRFGRSPASVEWCLLAVADLPALSELGRLSRDDQLSRDGWVSAVEDAMGDDSSIDLNTVTVVDWLERADYPKAHRARIRRKVLSASTPRRELLRMVWAAAERMADGDPARRSVALRELAADLGVSHGAAAGRVDDNPEAAAVLHMVMQEVPDAVRDQLDEAIADGVVRERELPELSAAAWIVARHLKRPDPAAAWRLAIRRWPVLGKAARARYSATFWRKAVGDGIEPEVIAAAAELAGTNGPFTDTQFETTRALIAAGVVTPANVRHAVQLLGQQPTSAEVDGLMVRWLLQAGDNRGAVIPPGASAAVREVAKAIGTKQPRHTGTPDKATEGTTMAKKTSKKKKKAAARKPSKKRPEKKKAAAKKKATKKTARKATPKKAPKKAPKKKAAKKKVVGRRAPNTRGRDVNVKGPVECVGGRPVILLGEAPAKRAVPSLRLSLLGEQAGVERDAALHRVRSMNDRAAASQLQTEALDAARDALRAMKSGAQAPAERAAAKALGCAAAAAQRAPGGAVAQAAKSGTYPSALGALGRLAGILKP